MLVNQGAIGSPKIARFTIQDDPSLSNFSQRWGKIYIGVKANKNTVKNFCANLILSSVNKLPHASNKFDLESVLAYYKIFMKTEN